VGVERDRALRREIGYLAEANRPPWLLSLVENYSTALLGAPLRFSFLRFLPVQLREPTSLGHLLMSTKPHRIQC